MMKRLFDFTVSLILLLILLPILLLLGVLVRALLGAPLFFSQLRPGLYGKPFKMIKFRTMKDLKDDAGGYLEDEYRVSKFGTFLRSTSLDELPGLWNVLKGDMSLVGPRPLLMEYLPLYNSDQKIRHNVKPGLTGWAQINGRNAISWEEKFELDSWYVTNRSFLLDLKILLLTVKVVLIRRGINQEGHVSIGKFTGTV